jgi:hypothetical protein
MTMPRPKVNIDSVFDALNDPALWPIATERWISERRSMWERRFDRLGDLLAETEEESAISL